MSRTKNAAVLAVLLAAVPALAAEGEPPFSIASRVTALAGGSSGLGTRRDSGGVGLLHLDVVPALRSGAFEVRLPVRFERDQAFGTDLTETIAGAAAVPEWRVGDGAKLGAEAGVVRVWRLDWPDQYQRQASGFLPPTDRYSYTALRAGANAYARAARHQHLRARWRVTSYDYVRDPNFEEQDPTPTHLTPRDNVTNELDLSWRYLQPTWALATRLETAFRRDSVYPARRARTGGAVPFTHQQLNDYEPKVELELRKLAGGVSLSLEMGWAVRDDTYAGYYSYSGPHPHVRAEWAVTSALSVVADAQAWWLRYGPDSKANTEDGGRLYDHRGAVGAEVRYAIGRGLSVVGEASWRGRTTNYPDYVPGVYPTVNRGTPAEVVGPYDVRWDYDNYRAVAGVEWRR